MLWDQRPTLSENNANASCVFRRISRRKLLARLRREIQTLQQLDGCADAQIAEVTNTSPCELKCIFHAAPKCSPFTARSR